MLATAIYPAFDPASRRMFSRRLATDELRGRLGFTGRCPSRTTLETAAASRYGSAATEARMSTRAGADLLLFASPTPAACGRRRG